MSADFPPQPSDSRAVLEWEEGGFTLVLPPVGFRAQAGNWGCCLLFSAALTFLSLVGGIRAFDCPNLFERLLWAIFLLPVLLFLRSALFLGIKERLKVSLERVTLVVSASALYVHWRGFFRTRERVWDRAELGALDEDAGAIYLLVEGKSETLLAERSIAELRWIAGLLRQTLNVPSEPANVQGIRVRCTPVREDFSWRGALDAKPGILEIRSLLRPGEDLRFVAAKHTFLERFRHPWTAFLTPKNITWLPGEADKPCLQIEFELSESCCLRIDSADPDALRAALARFWEPAPDPADIPLHV
jgi:hypothetical protein